MENSQQVFEMILENVSEKNDASVLASSTQMNVPVDWYEDHNEGQLAVDVAQSKEDIWVISTMAGVITNRIEVYVHNDLLTIKGVRLPVIQTQEKVEYFYQECFWGKFSRTIILPVDVKGEMAKADYKNGILTIRIPKRQQVETIIPISVVEE